MKVVCIGDSLTFGFKMTRENTWPRIVEKELNIMVVNKGICGDTTSGMLSRFNYDVLDESPTHLIIMGGTNDLIFKVPLSVIYSNLASIIYQAYHHQIVPLLGISIPLVPHIAGKFFGFTDDFQMVNDRLLLLRDWILNFSSLMGFETIDFFSEFYDYSLKMGKEDMYIDGVHPTIDGNRKMARLVIKALEKYL